MLSSWGRVSFAGPSSQPREDREEGACSSPGGGSDPLDGLSRTQTIDSGSTTFNYLAILVLEAAFLQSNPLILQMGKQGPEIFFYLTVVVLLWPHRAGFINVLSYFIR